MPALQFSLLKLHRHNQQNASGKLGWKAKGKWFVAAQPLSSLLTLTFVAVQHAFEVPATQGLTERGALNLPVSQSSKQ